MKMLTKFKIQWFQLFSVLDESYGQFSFLVLVSEQLNDQTY